MADLSQLIPRLAFDVPSERNRAAIELMDLGDPAAIAPLVEAIEKPANRHARGTLIYALSAFPCQGRFHQIFSWALEGGFEASWIAITLLQDQRLTPTAAERAACYDALQEASEGGTPPEFIEELYELLDDSDSHS